MFDRYTPRARRIVYLSEALAQAGRQPQAGTGHLLLAIMYEHESTAARALARLGLTRELAADAVCAVLKTAPASPWPSDLPFSPRLHSVLQGAAEAAIGDGEAYVGTGHLLLALVLEREPPEGCGGYRGTAVEVLDRLGVDLAAVSDTVREIMNGAEDHDAGLEVMISRPDTGDMLAEILAGIGRLDQRLTDHALNAGRRLGCVEAQLVEHMGDTLEVRQKLGLVELHVVE